MLTLTDFGCSLHLERQLKYSGPEAEAVANIVANLPSEGACHTYICDEGHTHRLLVVAQVPRAAAVKVRLYALSGQLRTQTGG